jgi:hypothetical protein
LGVLSQIGIALGIPRELLVKQFNSSYSASKAALLDAGIYFRTVRTWLARSFCQPVYETWLSEAVASGRILAPGYFTDPLIRWAYTRAAWHGDSMGSINPKDEVAAYSAAIDARLMTHERAEWELFGSDFNDTFDQKKAEHDQLAGANMLPVPKAGAAAPIAPATGGLVSSIPSTLVVLPKPAVKKVSVSYEAQERLDIENLRLRTAEMRASAKHNKTPASPSSVQTPLPVKGKPKRY